jgi:hypothetical protein
MSLGDVALTFRCGRLPPFLGLTLMAAGVQGIIGTDLLAGRVVGYFPRRPLMVL